jgi:hypothetical protein
MLLLYNHSEKGHTMKRLLLCTAIATPIAITLITSPAAHATLQAAFSVNGAQFTAADQNFTNTATNFADQDNNLNILTLAGVKVGGVIINSSTSTADVGTTSELNSTSLSVENTNPFAVTVSSAIGATGFPGPVGEFSASGSGTFQNALGGTMQNSWWDDLANGQGATAGSCPNGAVGALNTACAQPGTLVATSGVFTNTGSPNSYSFNFAGPVTDPALYSMTLAFQFTLPGATGACDVVTGLGCPTLVSRGQAEEKMPVPEPFMIGVLGMGVLGLGLARRRGAARSLVANGA